MVGMMISLRYVEKIVKTLRCFKHTIIKPFLVMAEFPDFGNERMTDLHHRNTVLMRTVGKYPNGDAAMN
jgi:hypothetical protein